MLPLLVKHLLYYREINLVCLLFQGLWVGGKLLGLVAHTCNPSTQEVCVGGSGV